MSPLVLALAVNLTPAGARTEEWATWSSEAFPFSICYPADIFQQRRVSDMGHAIATETNDSAQLCPLRQAKSSIPTTRAGAAGTGAGAGSFCRNTRSLVSRDHDIASRASIRAPGPAAQRNRHRTY